MAKRDPRMPCRPSEMFFWWYKDHKDEGRVYKDSPPATLALNWVSGYCHAETDELVEVVYGGSDTNEIDRMIISKRDLIDHVPMIKPRKAKE